LQKAVVKVKEEKTVMVISVNEKLKIEALKISRILRDADISAEVEVTGRKVAKALEDADRRKMDYAIIVGEKELEEKSVAVRDLAKRKQEIVKIEKIADVIRGKGI
jgi:histidyl-tRNA synthetase